MWVSFTDFSELLWCNHHSPQRQNLRFSHQKLVVELNLQKDMPAGASNLYAHKPNSVCPPATSNTTSFCLNVPSFDALDGMGKEESYRKWMSAWCELQDVIFVTLASSPSDSPLSPSFNFSLEIVKSSQFVASFYQHMIVQRRVKNPLEENSVVGITNYIDFGFELQTSVDDAIAANSISDSTFQIGASWQANKNFLLKAKVGPKSSTLAVAFKSWWKPSFTFNISATRDRADGQLQYGFGKNIEIKAKSKQLSPISLQ